MDLQESGYFRPSQIVQTNLHFIPREHYAILGWVHGKTNWIEDHRRRRVVTIAGPSHQTSL
jgi:hypothetical protein